MFAKLRWPGSQDAATPPIFDAAAMVWQAAPSEICFESRGEDRYRRRAAGWKPDPGWPELPQSGHRPSREADGSVEQEKQHEVPDGVDEEQSFVPRHCWLRRSQSAILTVALSDWQQHQNTDHFQSSDQ